MKFELNIEKLKKDAETMAINPNDSFFISYREFLNYFEKIETIDFGSMVIGIHFTYSWMPTIFDFRSNEFSKVIVILNKVKRKLEINSEDCLVLKENFNNSLVGTSKLLHFINPMEYSIWDSRVFRYIFNKNPYQYHLSDPENFLSYLKMCKEITNSTGFEEIHEIVVTKVGYEISKMRSLELIMYSLGGK